MTLNLVILCAITLERIAELPIARANTRRLLAAGGVEHSPGHYPAIVLLHVIWLAALWWWGRDAPVSMFWLGLVILVGMLRVWTLVSLGRRWTTRIITVPGEKLVARGPYRFVKHPNYWIVVAEVAAVPMVFGLWQIAVIFSIANAVMLAIRISAENRALSA